MDRVYRVEVVPLPGQARGDHLVSAIAALDIEGVQRVERRDLYFLRGELTDDDIRKLCEELVADPIVHRVVWGLASETVDTPSGAVRVEVGFLHGVTDTVGSSLMARAGALGFEGLRAAASAESYLLYGQLDAEDVQLIAHRLLYSDAIQHYQVGQLTSHVGDELHPLELYAESVPIASLGEMELLALSENRLLSLDLAEMRAVQQYFAQEGREPTDVELESIAQTWSEHCVHKTFKGVVDYIEITQDSETKERIDSLIRTYLQAATNEIDAPWVRSAFVDNAGIVEFTDVYDVSIKVETHNHPSALEPFGGANTGVGGVVRDIMGVSARPIANTDVLCVGPLDIDSAELPAGALHPRRIYDEAISGIEDYGNKMGIPTVNGAVVFEPGYTANPLVYCGCIGIAPSGSHPTGARAGDLVVVLGGRTGRDGLHGATFSSIGLTDETTSGTVQIGDPVTEKMMLDVILAARDERLYTAITDCGAGGLSSAVSEMGEETGVVVQLDTVPLKYPGLQPWEIWLSEAQERMVLAVPPENEARLRRICEEYSVEMAVIGRFTENGRLLLRYGELVVAELSMEFLHNGIPRRHLRGTWRKPAVTEPAEACAWSGADLRQGLLAILAHPNVRSKEDVVRLYDHEAQGGTVIKPFVGVHSDGPSDASVVRPLDTLPSWQGLAVGCGFNPAYGALDPYAMAAAAIDEAVRNVVAVGANPDRIALLDNFCWGNPLVEDRMGSLVRACKGCYDGALLFGAPFVSGKDSLNNEYFDGVTGQQVAIPPSLLITAIGIVPDVRYACTMDLKEPGSLLYVVGETRKELGESYYYRVRGLQGGVVPGTVQAGLEIARRLHRAITSDLVRACHDCSEGGLAVALAEMALAGGRGVDVALDRVPRGDDTTVFDDWLLFAESNSRYVVEVRPENAKAFEALLADLPLGQIGVVTEGQGFNVRGIQGNDLFALALSEIRTAWRGHIEALAAEENA